VRARAELGTLQNFKILQQMFEYWGHNLENTDMSVLTILPERESTGESLPKWIGANHLHGTTFLERYICFKTTVQVETLEIELLQGY
jgi:hypothetical protein